VQQPDSFNSSESSPEWRKVHVDLCKTYYIKHGLPCRASSTLHSHFFEIYSAFKQGVQHLSLLPGSPKCPTSLQKADEDELTEYITSLFTLLISDTQKKISWRSGGALQWHQCSFLYIYTIQKNFANSEQSLSWLQEKAVESKSKFERDQKNCEAKLSRKHAQEEEEMKEAAKNWKMVAESSVQLSATLGEMMKGMVGNSNQVIKEKLNDVKNDIMKKVEDKLDEKLNSILSAMQSMLGKKY
jgi:hypothetical protein